MNLLKNCLSTTAMLAASVGLSAAQANAQSITFNLPYETHWNNVVLEPGQYKVSIPPATSWPQTIQVIGNGKTVNLLATSQTSTALNGTTKLRLTEADGTFVVTKLDVGWPQGEELYFAIPKRLRTEFARAGKPAAKTTTLVPSAE